MSLTPAYTPLNWVNFNPGAAAVTVLNQPRTGESSRVLQGLIVVTGLSGAGSLLTVTRSVGGVAQIAVPFTVPIGQTSIEIPLAPFVARDALAVSITLRSDNAADSSVSGSTTLWAGFDTNEIASLLNNGVRDIYHDDDPVPADLTFVVESIRGSAAGVVRRSLRLNAEADCRFALDFCRLSGVNLARVTAVTVAALDSEGEAATWTVTNWGENPGAVWEKKAIVVLAGYSSGDTATVTVAAINKDGKKVAANLDILIE